MKVFCVEGYSCPHAEPTDLICEGSSSLLDPILFLQVPPTSSASVYWATQSKPLGSYPDKPQVETFKLETQPGSSEAFCLQFKPAQSL
jgi:hypothetical protein